MCACSPTTSCSTAASSDRSDVDQLRVTLVHEVQEQAELEIDVRRCLSRLPRTQAEVLVLMDIEGFTRDEVADMLSLRPGTVASRLRLARTALRVDLDPRVEATNPGLSWSKP